MSNHRQITIVFADVGNKWEPGFIIIVHGDSTYAADKSEETLCLLQNLLSGSLRRLRCDK